MTEQEKREKVLHGSMKGNQVTSADFKRWKEPIDGDTISRSALLAAYDAAHKGPPGGARKLIEEAPAVVLKVQEPRVLSTADIIDDGITPDVIWIERREESDVMAGVWQIDHYEMVGGSVVDDLGVEIAESPEAYNTRWRCWTGKPTEEQREAEPWSGDLNL